MPQNGIDADNSKVTHTKESDVWAFGMTGLVSLNPSLYNFLLNDQKGGPHNGCSLRYP